MSVCPAMRFTMLGGIELKVGMGIGDGPTGFVGIVSKRPHLGSKVIQGSICLKNALWLPNLVRRTPDQSIVHCWGRRSCRGHLGSTRGQIAQKCPTATKFGGRTPDQREMHCWGQRLCRGQLGSSWGPLAMSYGHQIWWEEPLIKV